MFRLELPFFFFLFLNSDADSMEEKSLQQQCREDLDNSRKKMEGGKQIAGVFDVEKINSGAVVADAFGTTGRKNEHIMCCNVKDRSAVVNFVCSCYFGQDRVVVRRCHQIYQRKK